MYINNSTTIQKYVFLNQTKLGLELKLSNLEEWPGDGFTKQRFLVLQFNFDQQEERNKTS